MGYADADGDRYPACQDCDDSSPTVNPTAVHVCNGIDDNCDDAIDNSAVDERTWYADSDDDGDGSSAAVTACEAPAAYVADSTDCDDSDATVHPGVTDTPDDGVDQACDGLDATRDVEVRGGCACASVAAPGGAPVSWSAAWIPAILGLAWGRRRWP